MARILCIDDQASRAGPLIKLGHEVHIAYHPDFVRFLLDHYDFDLVTLDHDMPIADGMEMAKEFLVERSIPVCVISANPVAGPRMVQFLEEWAVPVTYESCLNFRDPGWARRVVSALDVI